MTPTIIFATVVTLTFTSAIAAIILAVRERPNATRRRVIEALIFVAMTGAVAVSALLGR